MNLKFGAKNKTKRQLFFPIYQLSIFIVASIYLILVMFPENAVVSNFKGPIVIHNVTLDYIDALLVKHTGFRLPVLKEGVKLTNSQRNELYKKIDEALSSNNTYPLKVYWLIYQVYRWLVLSESPRTTHHKKHRENLNIVIDRLMKYHLDPHQLQLLADDAYANDSASLSLSIYKKIIKQHPRQSAQFYAGVAQMALSIGEYDLAGTYYLKAINRTTNYQEKRMLFIDAVNSYRSGEKYSEVGQMLEVFSVLFKNDISILFFMSKVALSIDKPVLAKKYIERIIVLKDQTNLGRNV